MQSFTAGNLLSNWATYTQDYELDLNGVYDGATKLIERTHTRTDKLNLTNIWDNVTAANNQSFWASPSNRLQNADGPWGSRTYFYDGVGNRTFENATIAGVTTSDNFTPDRFSSLRDEVRGGLYPGTSNRVASVVRAAVTTRAITGACPGEGRERGRQHSDRLALWRTVGLHPGSIPITAWPGPGQALQQSQPAGACPGEGVVSRDDQLISRVITNSGTANGRFCLRFGCPVLPEASLLSAGPSARVFRPRRSRQCDCGTEFDRRATFLARLRQDARIHLPARGRNLANDGQPHPSGPAGRSGRCRPIFARLRHDIAVPVISMRGCRWASEAQRDSA